MTDFEARQESVVFSAEEMTVLIALVQALRQESNADIADIDARSEAILRSNSAGLKSLVDRGVVTIEGDGGTLDAYLVWLIDATLDPVATLRLRTRAAAGARADAFLVTAGVFVQVTDGRNAYQLSVGHQRDLPERIEAVVLSDGDAEAPTHVFTTAPTEQATPAGSLDTPAGLSVVEVRSERVDGSSLELDEAAFALTRSSYSSAPPRTWTEIGWPGLRGRLNDLCASLADA